MRRGISIYRVTALAISFFCQILSPTLSGADSLIDESIPKNNGNTPAITRSKNKNLPYQVVDTGVTDCYDNYSIIPPPSPGEPFFGQDAQYISNQPSYRDNNNGTVTDTVTGLMWQQKMKEKMTFSEALTYASDAKLGGHTDWRLPTIKELYSLVIFTGSNSHRTGNSSERFIDTTFFEQPLGDTSIGERLIDAQTWSTTEYVGTTMRGDATVFGVNFIDGRIKGYPKYIPGTLIEKKAYFRLVRGNENYGKNNLKDNGDGTITDLATGLMWQQADNGKTYDWQHALRYAENLELAGYKDWRLPNAKELQSIVDYSRSPQTTGSAAINPLFYTSSIQAPDGDVQYPYFWSSTTHLDGRDIYNKAVYFAFGRALGKMHGRLMDVHGAGSQRSDPKNGNPNNYPAYWGPQGDLRQVFNSVRCVRTING